MTGYTVHTGATEKFVEGWDRIFKKGAKAKKTGSAGGAKGAKTKAASRTKSAAKKKKR